MSNLLQYFHQQGGWKLVINYMRSGVLWIAIWEFLCLGRTKKALELLRLCVEYKYYRKIRKKYRNRIQELILLYQKEAVNDNNSIRKKNVWICWFQGMDNAPELVKCCYNSVVRNMPNWEIKVITLDNYMEYVRFPGYIIEKFKKGYISYTHFSDLLRLELLANYGGLWLDATILCTSSDIPQSIINSDLFYYKTLKPGSDGHAILMSSWLLYAKKNNIIIQITKNILYEYWRGSNQLIDYFLVHYVFTIVCELFDERNISVRSFCNTTPHVLQMNLFEEYDDVFFRDLCKQTCFHKLTYKFDKGKINHLEGTYYNMLIEKYN